MDGLSAAGNRRAESCIGRAESRAARVRPGRADGPARTLKIVLGDYSQVGML
jgi:hypothetical protein